MDARSTQLRVQAAVEPQRSTVDFKRQVALFRRWSVLFGLVVGALFAVSLVVVFAIPPRYRATAEVLIDARKERVVDLNQVLPDLNADAFAVDTEVEVLKSRPLAEKVAADLGLGRDPQLNSLLKPTLWSHVKRMLAAPPAGGQGGVVDRLISGMTVARVGYTSVIGISARSRSPEQSARIANAFATLYLQQQLDAKTLAARRASDWLNARLGGLRAQVEAAEHEVERYKTAHGLMTLTDSEGATITEQEISNLDAQLASARGEKAEAEARLSAAEGRITGGGQGDDVGEVLNSPVIQDLRKQRDEAAKQIAELQGRYGPRHPELMKAERQRTELDAQIQQEIARVVSNLRVQAKVAQGRSNAIASALTAAKAALAQNNGASVELKELERNLESVRTLYQSFLDRSKQTTAQDGLAQSDARIVSLAQVPPSPDFPNRPLFLAGSLAGSMMLGLLAIWIAEAREDGLYAAEDIERRLGVACLGLIPSATDRSKKARRETPISPGELIVQQPMSAFAESFRALRANLFTTRSGGPIRTIAITSALPGEGKTTACICLGRTLARAGVSAVVVDCDLRRRTLNRLLAEPPRSGLLDVLSETIDLDAALIADGALTLLPLGEEADVDDDVLQGPAMDRLLETLRRRFKVVLLDTAPVLLVTETRALAAKADAALFLARWRKTPADAAASAIRLLEDGGAYVISAALTQVDARFMGRRDYPYAALDYPFYRQPAKTEGRALLP